MLTDDDLDSLDTFSLAHFAPNGKESVREYARAVERAAYARVIKAAKEQDGDALLRTQMRGCVALVESLMKEPT